LLGVGSAMLSFSNVMHLFAHKFAGLRAGRFPFLFVSLGSINYFLFRHNMLLY
jgi:hypothetical protein